MLFETLTRSVEHIRQEKFPRKSTFI